jgi:hypothetical protein
MISRDDLGRNVQYETIVDETRVVVDATIVDVPEDVDYRKTITVQNRHDGKQVWVSTQAIKVNRKHVTVRELIKILSDIPDHAQDAKVFFRASNCAVPYEVAEDISIDGVPEEVFISYTRAT